MRRAKINADRDASLVRVWRLAGFGYLQECHGAFLFSILCGAFLRFLLSQLIDALIHLVGKALDKHKASNLPGCRRKIMLHVDRLLYF